MNQTYDQSAKGGILGIITYLAMKYEVDPTLIAMSLPFLSAILAYASTKIGDPAIASFVGRSAKDGKPLNNGK